MADDPTTPPEPAPSEPRLGLMGRLAERYIGPLLEKPGKRASDYRRADTSTRAVLALVAALAGFGALVRWQAQSAAEAAKEQRQAHERFVDRMFSAQEEQARRQHDDMMRAFERVSQSIDRNSETMRAALLEKKR